MTGPLIFILPPLFYTKMLQLERSHDKRVRDHDETSMTSLNDTELLLSTTSQYGSIPTSKYSEQQRSWMKKLKRVLKVVRSECIIAITVIAFGLAATFTSTFYNILDIKDLNEFWSPCIKNISLSKMLIPR